MIHREKPLGVILAGGQSRRMGGQDKFLLPLGTAPMIGHIIERVRPQVRRLYLNVNRSVPEIRALGLPLLKDGEGSGQGPLAGLEAALRLAWREGDHVVATFACDVPFLPKNYIRRLLEEMHRRQTRLALPSSGDRLHPVCGLWHRDLLTDLQAYRAAGGRKMLDWVARHDFSRVVFSGTPDPFLNVNTRTDLDQAARWIKPC